MAISGSVLPKVAHKIEPLKRHPQTGINNTL